MDPSRSLRRQFLVCGKAGVGKSSLINSLVGYEVCQVNDPGLTGGTLGAGTKLNKVTVTIDNKKIDIYESPGLQDGTASDSEGYVSDMQQKCKDVDLFLYCVDMTSARFGTDDIEALGLITKTFGVSIWSRCLLVMTKANMVSLPASVKRKGEERDYHRRLYNNLLNTFCRHLATLGVPNTSYIPACAAGLCYTKGGVYDEAMDEYRYIWYVSDKANPSDRPPVDFKPVLWVMCVNRISESGKIHLTDAARVVFSFLNTGRYRVILLASLIAILLIVILFIWNSQQRDDQEQTVIKSTLPQL